MSAPDFEAIINANFSPHIEEWYEYDLGSTYEHVEPRSAVGKIAVEVHRALLESAKGELDAERYESDLDKLLYANEIAAAERTAELAEARYKVFEGMYFDMAGTHETARFDYPIQGGYQDAVSEALKRGIKELDRVWIPPDSKPGLISLNNEIASFLSLESDLHFPDLPR